MVDTDPMALRSIFITFRG